MGTTYNTDILISGAGPGGVTTALHLANKGIPCTLVDKAHFPRDKVCGDALSGKVVEVLQQVASDFLEDFAGEPVQLGSWGVSFFAPNRQELRVPFKLSYNPEEELPPGYIARRTDFDDLLLSRAKDRPEIEVIEGLNLTQFERTKSGIRGYAKDGQCNIHTRLFIAADGAQSPFARKMADHQTEPGHNCAGLRAYYKGVTDLRPDNFIELHFLKESLPGYFWIFPLPNGYTNVGIGMRSDKVSERKVNLKSLFREVVQHSSLRPRFQNARQDGGVKGFGLPLGSRKRALSGNHYMLVGDAGSLIDPFTGEGIGNAMISGMYAADQAMAARQKNDYSATRPVLLAFQFCGKQGAQ